MNTSHKLLTAVLIFVSTFAIAQPVIGTTQFNVVGTVNLVSVSSCVATKTANTFGWLVSVASTSNCGLNLSDVSAGDGRMQYLVGFGTLTQATFGSNDGSEFAMRELAWGVSTPSFANVPMTFVGYKNGVPVPGATLNVTSPPLTGFTNSTIVSFTSNLAFREVDDIRISSPNVCSSILALEYLTIATPTAPCNSPTLSVTGTTSILCNGGTGSATMSATGGSGFTYTWSPSGGNAASASGLSAGIYTLSAKNSTCSNIATQTVQITQPSAIASATGVTYALCNGGTGSASITASGGTGALTYSWSTAATGTVITAVAGLYTVNIRDANSCSATRTVIILQPSALVSSTAITNAACNAGTGSATITASGGTAPRTFSWSTAATTSFVAGVLAGTYTVKVTDANNCNHTKTVTITQPSALITSTAVTNVVCNGGTGSGVITASGGAGGYTYFWSSGPTTSVIAGVLAGVYTATVTDANNCKSINAVTITQPSALVTSTAVTHVACNGGNGSGTLTASGGTGSYSYLWSNGVTASVVAGVLAGAYSATVTDANNCKSTKLITVTQPSSLTTSSSIVDVLCNGGTGSATVTASGGAGSYSYLWSNGATSSVIASALAGVYTATTTDANSCGSIKTLTLTQPPALLSSTSTTSIVCNGANGSATLSASGGTGSYNYLWSNGATTSVITAAAGVYTATITDANMCTRTVSATFSQPPALSTATAVSNVLCNGGTGSATLTSSGGTGSYTYLWSGGATTSVIASLPAGVYTVTATDANACTSSNSVNITEPAALITTTAIINPLCHNGTASATLSASGGTGAYGFLWSSAATSSVISGLTPGIYTGTVTDANNCQRISTVSISAPSALTLTAVASSASVCSADAATLTASGSGGTGLITYTWASGPSNSIFVVNPIISSVYTVDITDANNCANSQTVNLTVAYGPTIAASSGSICGGQSFSINVSGAATYTYSGGSALVSPGSTTLYTVTGTATNGCVNLTGAVSQVTVNALPVITIPDHTICSGQSVTLTPGGANTYIISGGNAVVTPTATKSYSITGTSLEGCLSATAAISTVYVNSLPTITVNSGTICAGQSFTLVGVGASSYSYSGGSNIVSPAITSTYAATGTGTNGCVSASAAVSHVTVYALPTLTLSSGSICPGNSFTLNPLGAFTYTYLNGGPIVSPGLTTSYSVTGTSPQGCPASNTVTAVVTVTNTLVVSITGQDVICEGEATILTANGAATYSWSTNVPTATISLTPSVTTSYTAYGVSGTCSNNAVIEVTVHAVPVLTVTGTSTLCSGQTITLSASGADTYAWSDGGTGTFIVVSPSASINYSVIGTNSNNCSSAGVNSVTVYSLPTITANEGSICSGSSFTLVPSGAATYTYSSGTDVVSPASTSSYTITGTSAEGCAASNTAVISVTVNPLPVVLAGATQATICLGQTTTLNGGGASTYTWTEGILDGVAFTPSVTTTYSVSGTDLLTGCISGNVATQLITVNSLPGLSIMTTNSLLCSGETSTLTVIGAITYTWSNGSNDPELIISPAGGTSYSVIGTDANACSNSAIFVQEVSDCSGLTALNTTDVFFRAYPNPNNGLFTVELKTSRALVITNVLGKVVFDEIMPAGTHSLNIQNQAKGIYFVQVIEIGRPQVIKIIKE